MNKKIGCLGLIIAIVGFVALVFVFISTIGAFMLSEGSNQAILVTVPMNIVAGLMFFYGINKMFNDPIILGKLIRNAIILTVVVDVLTFLLLKK